jgi:dethiobiotin synthetase
VGKTVLSALLTAALEGCYWKPIQTGAREGTDREAVRRFAEAPEARLLPETYCFEPPVSPHLAAQWAGVRIDLENIRLPKVAARAPLIVEGAGGALVPINERDLMADLMRRLELPIVLVARTTLGTINHTLLALEALRARELEVRGVVMVGPENAENRRAIEHYGSARVVGHIPVLAEVCRSALLETFRNRFDRREFR